MALNATAIADAAIAAADAAVAASFPGETLVPGPGRTVWFRALVETIINRIKSDAVVTQGVDSGGDVEQNGAVT